MAIMRNFDAGRAPEGFPISQIINLFKPSSTQLQFGFATTG